MSAHLEPNFVVVFETYIRGELAQVEVATVHDPRNSRNLRAACEQIARQSFWDMDPRGYQVGQAVKAVEILVLS